MTNTRIETVSDWTTRTGSVPTRLPADPGPRPVLTLPVTYRDQMTPEALDRWEDEAALGEPVALAPVDRAMPCSNTPVEPDPLVALAERAGDAVDLWLYRGGWLSCEMVDDYLIIRAHARDGRGVGFDNRGVRGWHGTTSAREPWAVIGLSERLYWESGEDLDRALSVVGALEGVTEPAKRALQTLVIGAGIHMDDYIRSLEARSQDDLHDVEPLW